MNNVTEDKLKIHFSEELDDRIKTHIYDGQCTFYSIEHRDDKARLIAELLKHNPEPDFLFYTENCAYLLHKTIISPTMQDGYEDMTALCEDLFDAAIKFYTDAMEERFELFYQEALGEEHNNRSLARYNDDGENE